MSASPALRLTGVRKAFGDVEAVRHVDLEVDRGRIVGMLGPSGCGKTTVLRCIAGLERPDGGTMHIDGAVVTSDDLHVPAERRRVGMVFQDYALFPHLSVRRNVEFGLAHLPRGERGRLAEEALHLVGLGHVGQRSPHELSGGQQQRVALARALAPRPEVLLLDEPFSNLDAALRATVREDVRRILKGADTTTVFVTHDQEEALSLADEVAVMVDGRIHQTDDPQLLYTRPATPWVARFVGDADVVTGVRTSEGRVATGLGVLEPVAPLRAVRADVVVRPEMVRLTADPRGEHTVDSVTYFGHDQLVAVRLADGTLVRSRQGPELVLRSGDRVRADVVGPVVTFPVASDSPALVG